MNLNFSGQGGQAFEIEKLAINTWKSIYLPSDDKFRFIWIVEGFCSLQYNGCSQTFNGPSVICITSFQQVEITKYSGLYYLFNFNKEFYCIINHDLEVSCAGVLFFGFDRLVEVKLDAIQNNKFLHLLEIFQEEFSNNDRLRGEMLRILLKRFIIVCTRRVNIYDHAISYSTKAFDNYRFFVIAVELNFRKHHDVDFYGKLLFKSAKTLSNQFKKMNLPSPLTIIRNRILIEAKRLLLYSSKSIKEIAEELGFSEAPNFNRFFMAEVNDAPMLFRSKTIKEFKVGKN